MLLLHWSKGYYACQVMRMEEKENSPVQVNYCETGTSRPATVPVVMPLTSYSSFDEYWSSFLDNPKWFTAWPVFVHPSLKEKVRNSLNRINLGRLTPQEVGCVDKWKTYILFRIPSAGEI